MTASKASLENSRALVKVAEAENQRAKADLARLNKLDNRAVSRQQYDLAVSGAASAEAQLDAAHRRVNAFRLKPLCRKPSIGAVGIQFGKTGAVDGWPG